MHHLTLALKVHTKIILEALVGGTMRMKNENKVKEFIGKMCQNEYHSQSERGVKKEEMKKGVLESDTNTTLLAQLEVLSKQLAWVSIIIENVSPFHTLGCDLCGERHVNDNCVPKGYTEEEHYIGKFSQANPYSNTYNVHSKDQPNFKWENNQSLNANQGVHQVPQIPYIPPQEKTY